METSSILKICAAFAYIPLPLHSSRATITPRSNWKLQSEKVYLIQRHLPVRSGCVTIVRGGYKGRAKGVDAALTHFSIRPEKSEESNRGNHLTLSTQQQQP